MNVLIVETSRINGATTIAHVRNSIILQKELSIFFDCDITDISQDQNLLKQWDIIIFSYASGFADFTKIERLLDNQKNCKIGWITNEFELFANDFVKKNMTFMITNFVESAIKKAHRHDDLLVTNLNTLIMKTPNAEQIKKYGACYYGTFRKYRAKYFNKYLKEEIILSTSAKNIRDYLDCGASCKWTPPFSWEEKNETLNLFECGIYIEDTKTHDNFNFMANRFFESLYCNAPLFFDVSCINTIKKDSYNIDDYFLVDNVNDLLYKAKNMDKIKRIDYLKKNTEIALSERKKCIKEIADFLNRLVI